MICFPLDNTEYQANALGAWCCTRTRGVFASDGHFSVTANGDMTVTVGPGLVWLKADDYWGVVAYEINPQVRTIETADGALSRIDAVCVRLNKNSNVAELVIKKGAYSPQPPVIAPPVRDLNYDEVYVATISVRAGATEILPGDITDQRLNETYCGIMRDGVTGIPTQQLYNQWRSWMSIFTGDAQAEYDAFVARLQAFETSAQTDFTTWFDFIKGQLSEDAAGHLQNQIITLNDRLLLLETMTLNNDFVAPLATDDTPLTVITDDLNNAILADWAYKYKEV